MTSREQVRIIVCEWLAWLLRIKRPGRELSLDDLRRKHRVRRLEALIPPSASLISNVKDIDNTIPLGSRQSTDRETNIAEAPFAAGDTCPPYPFAMSPRPFFYGIVSPINQSQMTFWTIAFVLPFYFFFVLQLREWWRITILHS